MFFCCCLFVCLFVCFVCLFYLFLSFDKKNYVLKKIFFVFILLCFDLGFLWFVLLVLCISLLGCFFDSFLFVFVCLFACLFVCLFACFAFVSFALRQSKLF